MRSRIWTLKSKISGRQGYIWDYGDRVLYTHDDDKGGMMNRRPLPMSHATVDEHVNMLLENHWILINLTEHNHEDPLDHPPTT